MPTISHYRGHKLPKVSGAEKTQVRNNNVLASLATIGTLAAVVAPVAFLYKPNQNEKANLEARAAVIAGSLAKSAIAASEQQKGSGIDRATTEGAHSKNTPVAIQFTDVEKLGTTDLYVGGQSDANGKLNPNAVSKVSIKYQPSEGSSAKPFSYVMSKEETGKWTISDSHANADGNPVAYEYGTNQNPLSASFLAHSPAIADRAINELMPTDAGPAIDTSNPQFLQP